HSGSDRRQAFGPSPDFARIRQRVTSGAARIMIGNGSSARTCTRRNHFMSDASTLHAQQLAFWNGPAVARWITRQEPMDAALAPVQPGDRVLDIGCGSGATSIALARLVGPTGQVTGIDVSGSMIELARKRSVGMGNLDWLLADAAAHDFPPGSTDLLFSRFGV